MIENRRYKVMCQTVVETKESKWKRIECLEKTCMIMQKREGGAATKV